MSVKTHTAIIQQIVSTFFAAGLNMSVKNPQDFIFKVLDDI